VSALPQATMKTRDPANIACGTRVSRRLLCASPATCTPPPFQKSTVNRANSILDFVGNVRGMFTLTLIIIAMMHTAMSDPASMMMSFSCSRRKKSLQACWQPSME
jgi:hypothetical protein